MDHVETSRSLKVGVDDHDLGGVLLLARLVENGTDGLTELDTARSSVLGASLENLSVDGGLDLSEDVGAFRVSSVQVRDCRLTGASASC